MVASAASTPARSNGGAVNKKTLLRIGSSHTHRRPLYDGDASRMVDIDKANVLTFAKLKLPIHTDKTMRTSANGSWQKPDRTGRVKLTNTACTHWADGKCSLGDVCIFRHIEQCLPVQMYSDTEQMHIVQYRRCGVALPTPKDAYELPLLGEEMDVRIYVKNLPPTIDKSVLENIAKAYGHVDLVSFMKSTLGNSRVAGFIHMRSKARAEVVVERLNNTSIDGEFVSAKIQSCIKFVTPPKPLPSTTVKPKTKPTVTTDSAGFVTKTRGKAPTALAGEAPMGKALAEAKGKSAASAGKPAAGKAPAKAPTKAAGKPKQSMADLFAQLNSDSDDDEDQVSSDLLAEREELRCVIQQGMDSGADAEAMQNLKRLHELDTKLRAVDDMPALEETTEFVVAAEARAAGDMGGAGPSGVAKGFESPNTVIGFWADSERSNRMRNDMAACTLEDKLMAEKKKESRNTVLEEKERRMKLKQHRDLAQLQFNRVILDAGLDAGRDDVSVVASDGSEFIPNPDGELGYEDSANEEYDYDDEYGDEFEDSEPEQ